MWSLDGQENGEARNGSRILVRGENENQTKGKYLRILKDQSPDPSKMAQ